MILNTDRLKILSLSYEELVEYVKGHNGFIKNDEDEQKVWEQTLIPMLNAGIEKHLFYTFWIGYYEGEEVLQVGLLSPPNEHKVVEIWVDVNEKYRGKGLGTEAIKGLLTWVNGLEEVDFVGASVEFENVASKKMLLKCGFEYACVAQDMDIYFIKNQN